MHKLIVCRLMPLLACLLLSCSSEGQNSFYHGTVKLYLPDAQGKPGRQVGTQTTWIKRTVYQLERRIIETVLVQQEGQPPKRFTVYFDLAADESHFQLAETSGSFQGKGRLIGEKWHWQAWESESLLVDQTRVLSQDQLQADGRLKVSKQIYRKQQLLLLMEEEDLPISEADYLKQLKQVGQPGEPDYSD